MYTKCNNAKGENFKRCKFPCVEHSKSHSTVHRLNFVENMKTFVVKVDNLDASAALVLHITNVSTVTKPLTRESQAIASAKKKKLKKNKIKTKRKKNEKNIESETDTQSVKLFKHHKCSISRFAA